MRAILAAKIVADNFTPGDCRSCPFRVMRLEMYSPGLLHCAISEKPASAMNKKNCPAGLIKTPFESETEFREWWEKEMLKENK